MQTASKMLEPVTWVRPWQRGTGVWRRKYCTASPDTAGKKPGLLVTEMASQLRVFMLIKIAKSRSSKCFRQLFLLGKKNPWEIGWDFFTKHQCLLPCEMLQDLRDTLGCWRWAPALLRAVTAFTVTLRGWSNWSVVSLKHRSLWCTDRNKSCRSSEFWDNQIPRWDKALYLLVLIVNT